MHTGVRTAELVVPRSMPTTFSARTTTTREVAAFLAPQRRDGIATRLPWKADCRTLPREADMVEKRVGVPANGLKVLLPCHQEPEG